MEPLYTKEREAEIRDPIKIFTAKDYRDLIAELDATREALQRAEQKVKDLVSHCDVLSGRVQRFSNPWTVEILNQKDNQWLAFCHDAPLTLANAEKREGELKAEHPDAKFRVVPWFNSTQRQTILELQEQGTKAFIEERRDGNSALIAMMKERDVAALSSDELRSQIQRERELADQLAEALDKSQADICGYLCTPTWQVANGRPHHPICQSVNAALAQHAAVRSGK